MRADRTIRTDSAPLTDGTPSTEKQLITRAWKHDSAVFLFFNNSLFFHASSYWVLVPGVLPVPVFSRYELFCQRALRIEKQYAVRSATHYSSRWYRRLSQSPARSLNRHDC